jgi:ABC-type multidrug transport system fused ATPase/permease subunit
MARGPEGLAALPRGARLDTLKDALRLLKGLADTSMGLRLAGLLALVAISGALAALTPLALKHLVDEMASTTTSHPAAPWATAVAVYLLMIAAARLVSDVRPLLSQAIDQEIQARLTRRFFDKLMRLPLNFLLGKRSGEHLRCLDLAAAGSQLFLAHAVNSILPVVVEVATMAVILMQLGQPALVGIICITALAYSVVYTRGTPQLGRRSNAVSAACLEVHAQLNDGIAHVETLRSFGAESQARRNLKSATEALQASWRTLHRATFRMAAAASIIFTVSMAACLAIAANSVAQGTLTVGGFVLAGVYLLQMVRPFEVIGGAARDLARATSFLRPLMAMLAEPDDPAQLDDPSATAPLPNGATALTVRFENVHFGYTADRPVLNGLSLELAPGRTTAIVGRSGSGKSTVAKLLLRLYAPQQGRILLNGHPIETLGLGALRQLVGLVPQDTALLHASLAHNIALGLPDATPSAIEAAARAAQLHQRISACGQGYDAPVGERGMQLSGGERQRVAIARALLRRPALYILDEPTSMLDSKTEADILKSLRDITSGHTTLLIAHRLSTVRHADEIVVLDDGVVAERGCHDQLITQGGLYAQLWARQVSTR